MKILLSTVLLVFAVCGGSSMQFDNVSSEVLCDSPEGFQMVEGPITNLSQKVKLKIGAKLFDDELLRKLLQSNSSETCVEDVKLLLISMRNFELWALKMADSSAKLPSGILNGNINQYGDFDQCLSSGPMNGAFKSQYCLVSMQLTLPETEKHLIHLRRLLLGNEPYESSFEDSALFVPKSSESFWGVCVPSSCSREEVSLAVKSQLISITGIPEVYWNVSAREGMCQVNESPSWSFSENLAIGAFVLVGIFVILSTVYDCLTSYKLRNEWMLSFSILKNFNQMIEMKGGVNDIKSLDGVRTFYVIMLLLSHKTMFMGFNAIANRTDMNIFSVEHFSIIFRACYLYTEVFLMLSGLLLSYSILGKLNRGQALNIPKEIAARYFRFMAPIAALIAFATYVLPLIDSGPQWSMIVGHQADLCKRNGWRNLLMIQNFFGFDQLCMANTHHVGTDFLLFVVSIFLIIYLHRQPKKGAALIMVLIAASTFAKFLVVYKNELVLYITFGKTITKMYESADLMYIIPPYRFTVYGIGILLGDSLHRLKGQRLTQKQISAGWFIANFSIGATIAICALNQTYSRFNDSIFASIAPITLAVYTSWIILLSQLKQGNFLVKQHAWRGFRIFTNLSYSIFLVQFSVFSYNIGITRAPVFYTNYRVAIDLNEIAMVFAAAVILTLLIDLPFANLKKLIFDGKVAVLKVKTSIDVNENVLTPTEKLIK